MEAPGRRRSPCAVRPLPCCTTATTCPSRAAGLYMSGHHHWRTRINLKADMLQAMLQCRPMLRLMWHLQYSDWADLMMQVT
jgi:hypothetical protein